MVANFATRVRSPPPPGRNLVFDLNDFDETLPGLWKWDVKRLAIRVMIRRRHNGLSETQVRKITRRSISAIRSFDMTCSAV
ncbi:DUF2252 domain-containing protein [bacterium]|nr:DUF2252 domain-containing protein [bacterium]